MHGYLIDPACCRRLTARVDQLEIDVAAAQSTASAAEGLINTLVTADTEGFPWPFDGDVPPWELRIPGQPDAGIICVSKNDRVFWTRHELAVQVRNEAEVRVADTAGKPGLSVSVYWVAGFNARQLLGTVTSAGNGTLQTLSIPFSASVQGPGTFIFEATTPNPGGASGSYTISRYRIF